MNTPKDPADFELPMRPQDAYDHGLDTRLDAEDDGYDDPTLFDSADGASYWSGGEL